MDHRHRLPDLNPVHRRFSHRVPVVSRVPFPESIASHNTLHHHRAEHCVILSGTARVILEDKNYLLSENESTFIPIGAQHMLENPGKIPLELLEIQSGSYLEDDDIIRIKDHYGRC